MDSNINLNDLKIFTIIPSDYLKFNLIQKNYRSSFILRNISNNDIFIHIEEEDNILKIEPNNYRVERNLFKRIIIESTKEGLNYIKNIKIYLKILEPNKVFFKNMKQNYENLDIYDYLLNYEFQIFGQNNDYIKKLEILEINKNYEEEKTISNNMKDKSCDCNFLNPFNLNISKIDNKFDSNFDFKLVNNGSSLNNLNNKSKSNYNNILNKNESNLNPIINDNLNTSSKSKNKLILDTNNNENNTFQIKNDIDYDQLNKFLKNNIQLNKSISSEKEFENKFNSYQSKISINLKKRLTKDLNLTNSNTSLKIQKLKNKIKNKNKYKQIIIIFILSTILIIIFIIKYL